MLRGAYLGGIGRRYRGDPIGERKTSLQEANRAIIFHSFEHEGTRRQSQRREE